MKDKSDYKILHVEDEPVLQYLFQRQVQSLGFKITAVASDGVIAVEKVLAEPFDLVFMDVRMPKLDGIAATAQIRESERQRHSYTKIIGMTAFAERIKCIAAGMDDYLQKPVLVEDVYVTLEKWLIAEPVQLCVNITPESFNETSEKVQMMQNKISKLREHFKLKNETEGTA